MDFLNSIFTITVGVFLLFVAEVKGTGSSVPPTTRITLEQCPALGQECQIYMENAVSKVLLILLLGLLM